MPAMSTTFGGNEHRASMTCTTPLVVLMSVALMVTPLMVAPALLVSKSTVTLAVLVLEQRVGLAGDGVRADRRAEHVVEQHVAQGAGVGRLGERAEGGVGRSEHGEGPSA